jgi:hypothetical protein
MRARFPLAYTLDPQTRTVNVPREWQSANLVYLQFPQVDGRHVREVLVHRDAKPIFDAFLVRVVASALTDRILTSDGGFVPRLKRGSNVPANELGLSRHSRGIAIDLNAHWNPMGHAPSAPTMEGSMLELGELASACGLVWGGLWHGESCDPMHLEIGVQE